MPYINNWEEFAKASELLYLEDPDRARVTTKYRHLDGKLVLKVTDDRVCLKYLAQYSQDVKKIDKLTGQLMRHMASKEK